MKIIETERLVLRPFTLNDYEFILALLNTEGWIRYIGDRKIREREQAVDYLKKGPLKSYELNGFGLGLVQLKIGAIPIGMSGFIKRDYLDHPDIGFAFLPAYMGKGYGYEIAKQIVDYGFNQLEFEKILAITLPENSPSINLLKKLGFTHQENFIAIDTNEELCLYSISNMNPDA